MNSTVVIKKPELILGTVQLGLPYGINNQTGLPSLETSLKILSEAKDGGINSLDTAEAYGRSLEVIKVASASGLKFRIFTKVKPETLDIRSYVEKLLTDLNIQSLEGLSQHAAYSAYNSEQIRELLQLRSEGIINKLGVSVYTNEEAIQASSMSEIDIVQLPFNLLDGWNQRADALKTLKKKNKIVHIRSVFLQGLFFKQEPFAVLKEPLSHLRKLGDTWPGGLSQMAIDYVKQNIFIDGVLIGAETSEQVRTNCSLWNSNQGVAPCPSFGLLSEEAVKALDPRTWT